MNLSRINDLRTELEAERIDMSELSEIETAFAELDPSDFHDSPENAMASDMLNELESAAYRTIAENMLTRAKQGLEDEIYFLIGDRDDPYHAAMSSEWYDEQIAALRSAVFTVIDTHNTLGLRFKRTGIIVANRRLESIMEAAVMNNLPEHLTDSDPVVFTQTELIFGR